MDSFDVEVLTALSLIPKASQETLVQFFIGSYSVTELYAEIINLTERLLIYTDKDELSGKEYLATAVSMGNPHCVIFMDDVKKLDIEKIGPAFENHPLFPDRVNTEFIRIIDRNNIEMRVWERGSGETLACGTGSCAAVAACVLNGFADYDEPVNVHLRGGILTDTYKKDGTVFMEGSATKVFEGIIDTDDMEE